MHEMHTQWMIVPQPLSRVSTPQSKPQGSQASKPRTSFLMKIYSKGQPSTTPEYQLSMIRVSNKAQSPTSNISNQWAHNEGLDDQINSQKVNHKVP